MSFLCVFGNCLFYFQAITEIDNLTYLLVTCLTASYVMEKYAGFNVFRSNQISAISYRFAEMELTKITVVVVITVFLVFM